MDLGAIVLHMKSQFQKVTYSVIPFIEYFQYDGIVEMRTGERIEISGCQGLVIGIEGWSGVTVMRVPQSNSFVVMGHFSISIVVTQICTYDKIE